MKVPEMNGDAAPQAARAAGPTPGSGRNRLRCALLLGAAGLALGACTTVGPDYRVRDAPMPAQFAHAPGAAATTAVAAPMASWWTGFHDPTLDRFEAMALERNPDMAIAAARVDAARALAGLAQARLDPEGSASGQAAGERQSLQSPVGAIGSHLPGFERDVAVYDTGLGASWEIDLFGGLRRNRESLLAGAQASEAERYGVRVIVAAETADAYFRVRAAQRRIGLAEAQIATDVELQSLAELRLQEGLGTRRELAQAEARVAQVRATIPPLRTELGAQLDRLDVLMGDMPGTTAATMSAASSGETDVPRLSPQLTPADLLRRRPDVVAAERRLAASSAGIGVALAGYYPTASLGVLLGFETMNHVALTSATFQPQALAGIHWRLFDFGRVDAEVSQARGRNAEALAAYRKAMLQASEDVENALLAAGNLDAEREFLRQEVRSDVDARAAAEEAYRGGVSGLFEVLEQDRQLLAARDELVLADSGTARAAVATYRAMGGGW